MLSRVRGEGPDAPGQPRVMEAAVGGQLRRRGRAACCRLFSRQPRKTAPWAPAVKYRRGRASSREINWDSQSLLFLGKTGLFFKDSSLTSCWFFNWFFFFYWNYQKVDFVRWNERQRITPSGWKPCEIPIMPARRSKFSSSNPVFFSIGWWAIKWATHVVSHAHALRWAGKRKPRMVSFFFSPDVRLSFTMASQEMLPCHKVEMKDVWLGSLHPFLIWSSLHSSERGNGLRCSKHLAPACLTPKPTFNPSCRPWSSLN